MVNETADNNTLTHPRTRQPAHMTCFSLTELRPFSTSAACHPTPSRTTCLRIQVCSIRPVVSTSLRYGSSSNRRRLVPLGRGQLSLVSGRQIKGFETATLPELRRIDDRGAAVWYEKALELAREEQWEAARKVFQTTTALYPNLCRAWVSWAQVIRARVLGELFQRE